MADTKAKIDFTTGTIELEGSEAFVAKYLDEFKGLIVNGTPAGESIKQTAATLPAATPPVKKVAATRKASKKSKGAPKVSAEKYDIHGEGDTPSLKTFFDEKKVGKNNGERIAVIGYYITEILGNEHFTEGQIEYSYKMLGLDRPGHLHQIMLNNKSQKDYYEQAGSGESGHWVMTRGGDIFVADELPRSAE